MMSKRTFTITIAIAFLIYIALLRLVELYPSLGAMYAGTIAAFVAAAIGNHIDAEPTIEHEIPLMVATVLLAQVVQRLDSAEQRRAAADAELELMEQFGLDIDIDIEGLAEFPKAWENPQSTTDD